MENEDKMLNIDFNKTNQYHLIDPKWYELALAQGENCLTQLHSNIDSITSKVFWLIGLLFTVLGTYAAYAGFVYDKDPACIFITILYIGILPIIGVFASIGVCIQAIWIVDLPITGSSPSLMIQENMLSEPNKVFQYPAAAYKRAKDLSTSIGRAQTELISKAEKFTLAIRISLVSIVAYILFALIAIVGAIIV